MTTDPAFLKRVLDAIDRRDGEGVEGLRGHQVDKNLDAILATWRASLPWDAKDLYVGLFMDQKDAKLETLMRDALDSPAVETRSAAICYLTGNFAMSSQFLVAGGWVDPARVDAAIARWRNEVGPTSARACSRCRAPYRHNDLLCAYCGANLRPDAEDPGLFAAGAAEYEVRVGVPSASNAPNELSVQHALKRGRVGVRLASNQHAFLEGSIELKVRARTGAVMTDVVTERIAVRQGDRVVYASFSLTTPAEYEVSFASAGRLLAKANFRIVH